MPFRIALSGLDAASTDLQVTGHNIANAATNGFKQSRAEFADIYANSIQDVSTTSAGRGVRVSRVAQQFSQGNINFTASNLDLALSGEGFFVLKDTAGNASFTRAGSHTVDRDGYVVNHSNDRLQVFAPVGDSITDFNTGSTVDLRLPTLSGEPQATGGIEAAVNLDSSETAPTVAFDPAVATSFNHSTSTTVYDSLGAPRTLTMYFVKTATAGEWDAYAYMPDNSVPPVSTQVGTDTLQFDSAGGLTAPATGLVSLTGLAATLGLGANDGQYGTTVSNQIDIDFSSATQFGSSFSVNNLTQDGFAAGRLSGVDIDNSGVVFARFTNGQSSALGKVALAKFNNPQGLRQLGDTSWAETFTSGDVQMGEAGTSSFGLVQSGGLENSNVDIAEQLVNLITAQRNFQANAQVITTADTVTQTIINIR
jgi:flagellar hook protein FlgE